METPNTDNVSSKERHGVVSYSINGILGLTSEPASVKDRSSKNTKEAEEVEGNYKRFSDDCLLEQLHTYWRCQDRLLFLVQENCWRIESLLKVEW